MSHRILFVVVLLGALAAFSVALAQDQAPGAGQPPDQGRRGGNTERMMTAIKEQIGATDDDWKTLGPKVEKVMTLQRDVRGGFGGRGGAGGGGGQPDAAQSKVAQAQADLRAALEDKNVSGDDVAKKVTALRDARKKARAELEAAQKDLREGANARQEAVLVLNGLIE